jgi:3-oxoacyl-[acyl-carrier-protein] synthase I
VSVSAPPPRMAPVAITAATVLCAAGAGLAEFAQALAEQRSGLVDNPACDDGPGDAAAPHADRLGLTAQGQTPLPTKLGRVAGLEDRRLPDAWSAWDSRANRLAWAGLQGDDFHAAVQRAVRRHGAHRVALSLGTSASTIGVSEAGYRAPAADGGFPPALRRPMLNTPHAVALFVQQALGLGGPVCTVSTACSSSAKSFAQAERWLRLGLADAVVVGGVDALCASVLYGFRALGLMSPHACRPFDRDRDGISVGEAAGWALLQRADDSAQPLAWLHGYGESNDAHHMSSPHPQGLGAELALDAALARAGLQAEQLDYLNLHGTATPANDAVEAALVARRYRADVHASATKGLTGHTMGAAGIVEALACLVAVRDGVSSGTAHTASVDPALGPVFAGQLQARPRQRPARRAASHSFGFGGNNCVLIFGGADR